MRAVLAQRITPRYFDVTGVSAIPFEDVAAVLEPLAGQDITVGELARRVDAITALYRDRGYAMSFALLQNQSFKDGLVVVTVVEGHIASTRIEGDAGTAEPRLRAIAANLERERPLRRATLERYLNLIAGVPGVTVRPQLDLPRRADGATELVLRVEERRAFGLEGGLADMGLGLQGLVTATINSLTPLGEQTQVSGTLPLGGADVEYYRAATHIPLNSHGLALRLDAYKYRSTPEDALLQQLGWDRSVRSERGSAVLSYPLLLGNQHALSVSGGFYATRSVDRYTRVDGSESIPYHTDLRVVQAGLRYAGATARQSRSVDLTVHRGLERFGARQGDNSDYDLAFTRTTANVSQSFALPANFGVSFMASGQYSGDNLANSERISFGAWRYGLGYPAGEIAGDSGWGAALEANYSLNFETPLLRQVQPYVRTDFARAYENNPLEAELVDERRLSSVALGLRLSDRRHYVFDLNVAKPVADRPVNRRNRGLQFNANYSLRYD